MTDNPFTPATRSAVPVKVALVGPSGSGKTYTALRLARGIAGSDGRVALIDTEHGSASLYADEFTFDTNLMQPPYSPGRFAQGIALAAQAGYDVLIVDGISPAWNGPGGVMEIVDQNAMGGNSWSGWAKGSPAHQQLVQAILAAPIHLICTMRSKTAWVLETNAKGKQQPRKVGMEPIQRDGIDYEFSVVGELDLEHHFHVTKSRLRGVEVGETITEPGEELGALIFSSSRGVDTKDEPVPPYGPVGGGSVPGGARADESAATDSDSSLLAPDDADTRPITAAQVSRLVTIAEKAGVGEAAQHNIVEALTGQPSRRAIERWQYDQVISEIRLVGAGNSA